MSFRRDQLIPLTVKEYGILAALLESRGLVVSKDDLSGRLWPDAVVDQSNLFHHVRSLRKKLGARENGQSYIETIPGRGYRFMVDAAPETTRDLIDAVAPRPHLSRFAKWSSGLAMLGILAGGVSIFGHRKWALAASPATISVLTSPEIGQGPHVVKLVDVGPQPSSALLNAERDELFVSDLANDTVSIVDVKSDKVVYRVAVGHQPFTLVPSADRKKVFIAQQGGGVGVIDTATHSFQSGADLKEPVIDMVASPDGKSAYLALGFLGLAKLDLASKAVRVISKTAYVRALALTPDGHRLYVSYQAKGPGGSFGHDAIGYFDTATDRFAGAITGFANVGESIRVSPDGSQVWENGADACDSPQYDHAGCPAVPGGVLNIVSTVNNKLVRAIGVRGVRLQGLSFSPDGEYVAVGATNRLLILRSKDFAVATSLPVGSTGRIAFTADGLKAYSPVNGKPAVAVIQLGAEVRTMRLTNREDRDQTLSLGIMTGPEYYAESIDPGSLRLEGVPVQRTAEGAPAASVEELLGFAGHTLIVHFNMNGAKMAPKMTLVGRTYSGMPIRGTVDSPNC